MPLSLDESGSLMADEGGGELRPPAPAGAGGIPGAALPPPESLLPDAEAPPALGVGALSPPACCPDSPLLPALPLLDPGLLLPLAIVPPPSAPKPSEPPPLGAGGALPCSPAAPAEDPPELPPPLCPPD